MFSYDYTVTEEDYVTFNDHHMQNTEVGKKALFHIKIIMPILALFVVLIFLLAEADVYLIITEAVAMLIISVLWVIFAKKFFLCSLRRKIKKQMLKNSQLFSPKGRLEFDEEKIVDVSDKIEIKTSYSSVEKLYVTDVAFYFYIGPAQAIILPYHNFKDSGDRLSFFAWIKTVLGENKIIIK